MSGSTDKFTMMNKVTFLCVATGLAKPWSVLATLGKWPERAAAYLAALSSTPEVCQFVTTRHAN